MATKEKIKIKPQNFEPYIIYTREKKIFHFEPSPTRTALHVMRRLRARYDRMADGDWFKGYRSNSYRTSSNSPVTAQRLAGPGSLFKR